MKIFDCQQGSSEWLALRSGIPTASNFDQIVTKSGKPSASAEGYMYELLAERMMQHPSAGFMSKWMERGREMEAEAVAYYDFQRDTESVAVGFITDDAGRWGASPDRLVGKDGLVEIKCPKDTTHVGFLLQGGTVYDKYKVQAQGQLWVAEKQWTDVLSYHPEMPKAIYRTERDEKFIEVLKNEIGAFVEKLEALTLELKDRGWIKEKAEPFDEATHAAFAEWSKGR